MKFFVEYDQQPIQFLKKLDKSDSKRIMDKLDVLFEKGPVPHDAKKIIGKKYVFRIRIGKYRALYRVNYKEKKNIVFEIGKRDKVY